MFHVNVAICATKCDFRQRPCAGPCICTIDSRKRDIRDIAAAGDCEKGFHDGKAEPPRPSAEKHPPFDGSAKWAELHRRAIALPVVEEAAETEWINGWSRTIPCGECTAHWTRLIKELPPDLTSPAAYFRWTVSAHNRVNARIGKQQMTEQEARARWSILE